MSDTPRTDALLEIGKGDCKHCRLVWHARQLERELQQKEFQLQDLESKLLTLQSYLPEDD